MINLNNKIIAFHIHTRYSFDSIQSPESVVDYYIKQGYEIIVITDHNEIEGACIANEYAYKKYNGKIEVVVGEEIYTDIGDIIGFPLTMRIEKGNIETVIEEIRRQNGYVCIPHPYSEHDLIRIHNEEIISKIDFVEVINCRLLNNKLNDYAGAYAGKYKIRGVIGIDAHLKRELGNGSFIWDNDFNIREKRIRITSKRIIRLSAIIKAFKRKQLVRIPALILLYILGK